MNNKLIKNVSNPIDFYDVVTKIYCDDKIVTNSNILENSLALNRLVGISSLNTNDYVVYNNGSTGKVNNNHLNDGGINPLKLTGTSSGNDGLSYLNNKGQFVVVSSGSAIVNITSDSGLNTKAGSIALNSLTSGQRNTAFGYSALNKIDTAQYNSAFGTYALNLNTTSGCTAVGSAAGVNNNSNNCTFLGMTSGAFNTWNNCTFIGAEAGISVYNATNNYQIILGNSSTAVYAASYNSISDQRDKAEIRDTVLGLDFVNKLRPVDYKWNYRGDYYNVKHIEKTRINPDTKLEEKYLDKEIDQLPNDGSKIRSRYHHGLIAQEVKQVINEIGIDFGGYQDHSYNGGGDQMTIGYSELIGPLIKAVQELSKRLKDLENK